RAVNAEDDAGRAANMKLHVGSVKTHIDTLSAKKYHELDDGSVDYVILFMPIESAFSEAVQASPDLSLYASERNIVIASPTNLMVALKTVDNLWSIDRRNKNALEIAKRAGLLYDKFVGFTQDMEKVGERLTQAQTSHAAAINKLSQGSGNLVGQVETLKVLGAKAAKQIAMAHEEELLERLSSDQKEK
ncbi:MAG: DNA recombination protein RmuC, partial [Rhodobacteraceae bacterium]|nr:DNA recombination protein RmuC [Paracoccaceae bacterium]